MGLFDRFTKPKWEHKDWKKRLEAVEKLDDQEILSTLAFKDNAPRVRTAAIKKITDERILVKHAKDNINNQDTRIIAVDCINNPNLLTEIAKMDCIDREKLNKASKFERDAFEIQATKYCKRAIEVCTHAVDKIKNPTLLKDIAFNATLYEVREYTIQYIYDENDLVELALKDSSLRKIIVDKLNTKSSFVNLALNLPEGNDSDTKYVCKKLVQNINSEQDLIKIVNSAKNSYAREFAAEKVTDEKTLIKLSKSNNSNIRAFAVEKITDNSVLLDVAKNDRKYEIRKEAIDKIGIDNISDESVLLDVAKNDRKYEIRKEAIDKIGIDNISDESVLADVVIHEKDFNVCKKPIDKITNQNLLSEIALNAKNSYAREFASKKITNKKLIEDKKELKEKAKLNERIEELTMNIAYSDSTCGSDCVELAKLYEQVGDKDLAKRYYNRAINEYQIIIDVCKRENRDYTTWSEKQDEIRGYIRKL